MQSLRCTPAFRALSLCSRPTRHFASSSATKEASGVPWFVDQSHNFSRRNPPPHLPMTTPAAASDIPADTPEIIRKLHAQLLESPHLDKAELLVSKALLPAPGPALPRIMPHGRRKRGGTFSGESGYDMPGGGIWDWVVMAQVKEGTESRGSIESVVRVVRKTLLTHEPPLPLPPKSRRQAGTEWVFIDAGSFAVHVMSKGTREKYFNSNREW
ncbi:hypothetical protein B0H34DRAFT_694681 [Crassisporium funariophilum]|nr:hypothetical protein B0H34DRAFT_694681 [Crassisporium funariophilum]